VDKCQFTRLFELLLKDELVSLPPGCQITISAEVLSDAARGRSELHIEVRDNGPGLPKESLRVLFDPFAPRSDSPAEYGINLMACYFIVHHHGGKIEATSEEGRGTTFRLCFPTDPNSAPLVEGNPEFLQKLLANDAAWERIRLSDRPS
jgi:signal transduction histidine kinase